MSGPPTDREAALRIDMCRVTRPKAPARDSSIIHWHRRAGLHPHRRLCPE